MNTEINIYEFPKEVTLDYQVAVMQAALEGKRVESRHGTTDEGTWQLIGFPAWNWGIHSYRIAPEPKPKKRVLLTMADFAPVTWVRNHTGGASLVIAVNEFSFAYCSHTTIARATYADISIRTEWQWSPDRINWNPCYKEVEG